MRTALLTLTLCFFIFFYGLGQEKWTCYTDDKLLLMDDYRTLGVFEYTDGTLWMVTDRGINIFNGKTPLGLLPQEAMPSKDDIYRLISIVRK